MFVFIIREYIEGEIINLLKDWNEKIILLLNVKFMVFIEKFLIFLNNFNIYKTILEFKKKL